MNMKKYEFTGETMEYNGHTLHRIKRLSDGIVGGWIEQESNLSHDDDCFVYNEAKVFGCAMVSGNAKICDKAVIRGYAIVRGYAMVFGKAMIYGNVEICGDALVSNTRVYGGSYICGDAVIKDKSDYMVFKNNWSSGRYFTYTRSNKKWSVGCFYGTGDELIKKAYNDSKKSGDCYKAAVEYCMKTYENLE